MKSSLDKLEGLARKLNIEVPAEKVQGAFTKVYQGIQKSATIKGFRKGKAPLSTIRSMYRDRVLRDVVDELVSDSYGQALKEHSLNPIGYPKINIGVIDESKDFTYSAEFEIRPEVTVQKFENLEVKKEKFQIEDKQIDDILTNIQQSHAEFVPVFEDRPAQTGDFVDIDFEGTIMGEPLEGGSAQGHILELGSNQFIPGFEEAIEGMKVGQEKVISLSFPEDYHNKELGGKPVNFKTKLNQIKKKSLPERNDELAKKTGQFETLEELKEGIRQDIANSEERRIKDDLKNRILKALVEANSVEAPQSLVAQQKEMIINDLKGRMQQQGLSEQEYAEYVKKWDADFNQSAEFMVKSTFLVDALAEKLGLQANDSDVETKMKEYAKQSGIEYEKVKSFYQEQDRVSRLKFQLTEDKVVSALLEKADIKEVSAEELKED